MLSHFLKTRWALCTLLCVLMQQVAVGVSTYWMGTLGTLLVTEGAGAFRYLWWIFGAIMAAYLLGASSILLSVRWANAMWKAFLLSFFARFENKTEYATVRNKKIVQAWLGTEALMTFQEASEFFRDGLSSFANSACNLIALFFLFGPGLTMLLLSILLFAMLFVALKNASIKRLGKKTQTYKAEAIAAFSEHWNQTLLGNQTLRAQACRATADRVLCYTAATEQYQCLENSLTILPILVGIPAIVVYLQTPNFSNPSTLSAIAITVPRIIQMLQQTNAFSCVFSHVFLFREKLKNVYCMETQLQKRALWDQIHQEALEICTQEGEKLSVLALIARLDAQRPGRYCVSGPNGAGKSTLLLWMKSVFPEALFLSPYSGPVQAGSTGECQKARLDWMMAQPAHVLLLDEWDAHLDRSSKKNMISNSPSVESEAS